MPYLKYINDEGFNIARGLVRHTSHINKFGRSAALNGDFETVWSVGAPMVYPDRANTVIVVSSSGDDTAGGTGAQKIEITGIDENYYANTLTIPLAGASQASNADIKFWRVYRTVVTNAGSGGTNDGNITLTIGGNTASFVGAGDAQSLQSTFTTAKNQTGYIIDMMINTGKDNKAGLFRLVQKHINNGNVFNTKQIIENYRNSIITNFPVPLVIPPLHDIEIQGKNSSDSSAMSGVGNFNIVLVEDPFIDE